MSSRKYYIVLSTIITVATLTAAVTVASMYYLDATNLRLTDKAREYEHKNELMVTLWDVNNQRSHILQSMLLEPDPFERDRYLLKHLAQAARFAETRQQLVAMDFDVREKRLLDDFSDIIKEVQPVQDKLVQLAFEGDYVQAHLIMQTGAYVELRAQFAAQFQTMMSYYREITEEAFTELSTSVLKNVHLILLLTAFVLLLCVVVGFFIMRKAIDTENRLRDEVAQRIEVQNALEIHRQHLEEEVQKEVEKYRLIQEEHDKSETLAYAMGQILEDSLNEIYIFDANTMEFIQVNKAARDNTGFPMLELKHMTLIDLSPALSKTEFKEMIRTLLDGGKDFIQFTGRLNRKNKTTYPVEIHLQMSMMEYSPVIVAMVLDITERKQIEDSMLYKTRELALAENELEYQKKAMDEHAIVGVLDKYGCLQSVNQKFIDVSGFTEAQLLGGNVCIGTSGDQPEEFFEDMTATMQRGEIWHGEMCNHRKDGIPYWTKVTITPFVDTDGKIDKFISISTDFTAQKLAEQALRSKSLEVEQAHKQLESTLSQAMQSEKLASVGQLAAGIAHEINTPIQFVGDNTRFLQDAFTDLAELLAIYHEQCNAVLEGQHESDTAEKARQKRKQIDLDYLNEEIPNAISQTLEGVERVTRIVRSMKDFSHPGSDDMELIDINHAIESTTTVCRNEWKYDAELITDFDPELNAVPCFPGELNQVMLNIIVNASHAIHDSRVENDKPGIIKISTKLDRGHAEIRIEDNGSGMPEDVRKRIFEPFYTTKGVGKGSGQGLAIAWSVIVDKHHGTIDVNSIPGEGTTFTIRLPMRWESNSGGSTGTNAA